MLRLWLNEAPDGILCVAPDGHLLFGNAYLLTLLGYTEPEFARLDIGDTYDYSEAHLASARLKAAEVGVPQQCERRMRRKDGTCVPVEIRYVRLPNGTYLGVVRDISERKATEQRLTVQLAVARVLAEGSPFPTMLTPLLRAIGDGFGWDYCAIWTQDAVAKCFRCSGLWQRNPDRTAWFAAVSRERTFERGVGLIGQVWAGDAPIWVVDVTREATFPRAPMAAHDGLLTACAFPIRVRGEVAAVMELISHQMREEDERLLETVRLLAAQISSYLERGSAFPRRFN